MSNLPTPRILSCALAVGLLLAVVAGVSVSGSSAASSSGAREAGIQKATVGAETVFSPAFALIGFLVGASIGAGVGLLWGRSGPSGSLGFALVTLMGGFAGLVAAALLGAQAAVTATETSASMEHGPPLGVLIGGAVLGMMAGAACAWLFRPVARFEVASAR